MIKAIYSKLNKKIAAEIFNASLLFFLTIIYFNNLVINQKLFLSGDMSLFFYPSRIYAQKSLENFIFPLWNTNIFSGVPYIADIQNAFFYPFTSIFYFFPAHFAITSTLVIHIFLSGWFVYLLMKYCFSVDSTSSIISGIIYMFSGFFTMHMGHLNQIMACSWTPLIILVYIKSVEKRNPLYIPFMGTLFGLQIFTGGIQNIFYLVITLFILSIYKGTEKYLSKKDTKNCIFPFLYLVGGVFFGVAVSAIQFIPTYELTNLSHRSHGLPYNIASADSLSPLQFLISFILPNYFGSYGKLPYWGNSFPSEMAGYIGILPLALSIYALIHSKEKKYTFFFWITAIIALIFAMGKYTPVYKLFFDFGFNRFRSPARFIYIFDLSIAILAGFGMNRLLSLGATNQKNKANDLYRRVLMTLLLLIISASLYYLINYPLEKFSKLSLSVSDYISMWHKDAIITIVSIISVFIIFERGISIITKKIIIFSVVIFSLYNFIPESEFHNANLNSDLDPRNTKGKIVKYLEKDKSLYRIYRVKTNSLIPNSGLLSNIEDIQGYGSGILPVKRYYDFFSKVGKSENGKLLTNLKTFKMLNVKYIVSDLNFENPALKKILTDGPTNLYLNSNFAQRAFLTDRAIVLKNDREMLHYLSKSNIDFQETILLNEEPLYQGKESDNIMKNDFVNIISYSPNSIEIEAGLTNNGVLFLSDTYYPGWKVFIDDVRGNILRANYNFRGVALNRGVHKVIFQYDPKSFNMGIIISLMALITFLVVILILFKLRYKKAEILNTR